MKTAKIRLNSIKESDGWSNLIDALGISAEMQHRYFEWGEYASLELEIDEHLNVVSGRVLTTKE